MFYACAARFNVTENLEKITIFFELNKTLILNLAVMFIFGELWQQCCALKLVHMVVGNSFEFDTLYYSSLVLIDMLLVLFLSLLNLLQHQSGEK